MSGFPSHREFSVTGRVFVPDSVPAEGNVGGRSVYKLLHNPVAVPNPATIGLAVLGVLCEVLGLAYLSASDYVGWALVSVGLFLFAGAAGVSFALRTAGVLAAAGVLLLILSVLVVLPT